MGAPTLAKIAERSPAEVCTAFEASEETRETLASNPAPEDFLRELITAERFTDAVQYLAHALPNREAVWWSIVVVRECLAQSAGPSRAVLDAAEAWVRSPNDTNRRAAMAAADGDMGSPASMVGVAAFMSEGSIAPESVEEVPAPAHLNGTMVASAIILTAVTPDPLDAAEKYRRFLARGIEIAQGPKRQA